MADHGRVWQHLEGGLTSVVLLSPSTLYCRMFQLACTSVQWFKSSSQLPAYVTNYSGQYSSRTVVSSSITNKVCCPPQSQIIQTFVILVYCRMAQSSWFPSLLYRPFL